MEELNLTESREIGVFHSKIGAYIYYIFMPFLFLKILSKILSSFFSLILTSTVVGDYINTMKTTFDLNFDVYQAVKQHGYA